jgi:hypothetical protein
VVEAGRMAAPWFACLVVGAHVLVANKPAFLSVDQEVGGSNPPSCTRKINNLEAKTRR